MNTFLFASLSILILLSTDAAVAQAPQPETTARPTGTSGTTKTTAAPADPRPAGRIGAASAAADYRLVPGDKLRVDVYKDENLSQSLQVRPDGKITLPLLGDIVAAGRTPTELRDVVAESLKQYITEPVVTVIVVESVPPTIFVMGEVAAPGPQPLSGQLTVLQALASAGGFKDFAKTKDIRILRKTRTGTETIRFNYNDAIKGRGTLVYVQPGDTIIVP